jgi:hypothetical protein
MMSLIPWEAEEGSIPSYQRQEIQYEMGNTGCG